MLITAISGMAVTFIHEYHKVEVPFENITAGTEVMLKAVKSK